MAYTHFEITRLPVRTGLKIKPSVADALAKATTNFEYPIAVQQTMTWDSYGEVGEPLDSFGYKLKTDDNPAEWTEEIDVILKNLPEAGTPVSTTNTIYIPSDEISLIDDLFISDTKADRIEVEEQVSGAGIGGVLKIKEDLLKFGRPYMLYDFKGVNIEAALVTDAFKVDIASIKYRLGKISAGVIAWSSYANLFLKRQDYASLYVRDNDNVQTSIDFSRKIYIKGGEPETSAYIKIVSEVEMANFSIRMFKNDQVSISTPLELTAGAVNYVNVPVNKNGLGAFVLEGAPTITFDDPYLFTITTEMLLMNGDAMLVDPSNNLLNILIYNDASLLSQFDMLESVSLSEASNLFEATEEDVIMPYPSALSVTAIINKRVNVGTGPFTYSIDQISGTSVTITPVSGSKFTFPISSADDYVFLAKITDSITKIVSEHVFQLLLTGTAAGIPVITNPGAQSAVVGVYFSLALSITNTPLTSVTPSSLPAGLSMSLTGVISGIPTTVENPTASIVVANSVGSSTPATNFSINVVAAGSPPVITGTDATYGNENDIWIPEDAYYEYFFSISNSPTSVRLLKSGALNSAVLTDLTGGNYKATIYLAGTSGVLTIRAANASGPVNKIINVYSDDELIPL